MRWAQLMYHPEHWEHQMTDTNVLQRYAMLQEVKRRLEQSRQDEPTEQ